MLIASFSGIRGIYGKELTDDVARKFCYCYGQFLGKNLKVVVGTDTRESSERLKQAVFDSIDAEFVDVGVMPTPAVELAVREYKADGGVIITASHNEPRYNGFKFLGKDGAILRPKDMNAVIKRFFEIKGLNGIDFFDRHLYKGNDLKIKKITKKHKDALDIYFHFLNKLVNKNNFFKRNNKKLRDIKILIDPNGGAGIVAKGILKRFGVNVASINNEPGKFARLIEPNGESLSYLKGVIAEKKADFGAGFDCDADRVELILPDGSLVDGNYALALCIYEVLNKKNQTIVVNDATSGLIIEIADGLNAKVIETEVGEINVVDEMYKKKAAIGGEGSNGGVIVPPSKCRDGILTLLLIIKLIIKKNKSLKELIGCLPKYYTLTECKMGL